MTLIKYWLIFSLEFYLVIRHRYTETENNSYKTWAFTYVELDCKFQVLNLWSMKTLRIKLTSQTEVSEDFYQGTLSLKL